MSLQAIHSVISLMDLTLSDDYPRDACWYDYNSKPCPKEVLHLITYRGRDLKPRGVLVCSEHLNKYLNTSPALCEYRRII